MKAITVLISLLFFAGIAGAEVYTVALCGNSFNLADQDTAAAGTIYRNGDTIVVTQVAELVSNESLDEYGPGSHNESSLFYIQTSTPADFYLSCVGCPETHVNRMFEVPIHGDLVGGKRTEFISELRKLPMKRRKHAFYDLNEPEMLPKWHPFTSRDSVYLWIWGTAGRATVNGVEWPCFFLANAEGNCLDIGGDPMFPWELLSIVESVLGSCQHFYIHLDFAFAASWEFWFAESPGIYVWSGCGASEYCYIVQGDEACFHWEGWHIDECYFPEPLGHRAECLYMHDTDGDYNPYSWDRDGDYRVMISEANVTLTERCRTSTSYTGSDRKLYLYDDIDPTDGDGNTVIEVDISPNPFNPETQISFYLPSSMDVELSVFNILGRKVSTVFQGRLPQGEHRYSFNGASLTSGIYFICGVFDGEREVKKMSLIK